MAFFHTPERAPPAEEHAPLRQPTAPTNFIIISLYFTDFQEIKQLALFLLSLDNTFFYLFRQLISVRLKKKELKNNAPLYIFSFVS